MFRMRTASSCSRSASLPVTVTSRHIESRRAEYMGRGGPTAAYFFNWRFRKTVLYCIFGLLSMHFIAAPKRRHFMAERVERQEQQYEEFDKRFGLEKGIVLPEGISRKNS